MQAKLSSMHHHPYFMLQIKDPKVLSYSIYHYMKQ